MIKADPEPVGFVGTDEEGAGNVRVPLTRRAVIEWMSWIDGVDISIRVPCWN
jgi:hypothetical protein